MDPRNILGRLTSLISHFARERRGIAAVEFALVLPVMLVLYLGGVEISQEVSVARLTSLTASTVANLVSQYTTISASQTLPDILNASSAVLTPYPQSNAVVTVSCIQIDSHGNATVAWSQSLNGTARPTGQSVTVPTALDQPNTELVFGETTYSYTPWIDFLHIGTRSIYSSIYMLPRASTTITLIS
jgi:Flp pilus assembly protein TadG